MGVEKFIEGRKQGEHHFGRHSVQMAKDAVNARFKAWVDEVELPRVKGLREVFRYPINLRADNERRQRIAGHDQGHFIDTQVTPDQYPEGIGTEIELFYGTKRDCDS